MAINHQLIKVMSYVSWKNEDRTMWSRSDIEDVSPMKVQVRNK